MSDEARCWLMCAAMVSHVWECIRSRHSAAFVDALDAEVAMAAKHDMPLTGSEDR